MGATMTTEQRAALDAYVAAVRARYGRRLVDILVFGSRARGDAHDESDVDLAVILREGNWTFFLEKMALTDLAYQALLDTGLSIESWPVDERQWQTNDPGDLPFFIDAARRDAKPVHEAA